MGAVARRVEQFTLYKLLYRAERGKKTKNTTRVRCVKTPLRLGKDL